MEKDYYMVDIEKDVGRFKIPARLQGKFGNKVIFMKFGKRIFLLTQEEWERLVEKCLVIFKDISLPEMERLLYGFSFVVEIETQRRIVIPDYLRRTYFRSIRRVILYCGREWIEIQKFIIPKAESEGE